MDFLKQQPRLHFMYGGKPMSEAGYTVQQTETADTLTTVYTMADGLKLTNIATKHGDAYEWVNWWENNTDHPSEIVSELWDGYVTLPLPHEEPLGKVAQKPAFNEVTMVYAPRGSYSFYDELSARPDRIQYNRFSGQLTPGLSMDYATSGGRSCDQYAPFFNIHKDGKGYIVAVGWTGQWNCKITRNPDDVLFQTKIEDTHFRLLPGEKFRTGSIVIMPYEGTVMQSQNKWRRLVRTDFSLIGQEGRDAHGPVCAGVWGGMKTSSIMERLRIIKENELPFEYIWMDAGWYGIDTKPTPDEYEGDWPEHTGDWRVSPLIHPNGLKDVAQKIHENGMKFILWVEPERVRKNTPIVLAHPEYFIESDDPNEKDLLLRLGNPDAWQYCYETLCRLIEEIGVDCYRQDFNMYPLSYWRKCDAEDRRGITEITHINGLYRLWDALLEKFPHLLIDNCASGGKRIDIETLRRSIPLWRSDSQCPANFRLEVSQCHHLSFNYWLPYSGTGGGRPYDTYRIRSSYSPAMSTNYTFSERDPFGDDPEKLAWIKARLLEYKKVRSYMTEDFYPLTEVSDRSDIWSAAQFHRPSSNDGVVQVFRRERSPYETACIPLYGLEPDCEYVFTDVDDADYSLRLSGAQLMEQGFPVSVAEKRSARIYFYQKA